MNTMIVTPFENIGELRFGMTPSEVEKILGPSKSAREVASLKKVDEKREGTRCQYRGGELKAVFFVKPIPLELEGVSLFEDPVATHKYLMRHDTSFRDAGAYANFPKFGLCIGGFGKKRIPEGKVVIVYAKRELERYDEYIDA